MVRCTSLITAAFSFRRKLNKIIPPVYGRCCCFADCYFSSLVVQVQESEQLAAFLTIRTVALIVKNASGLLSFGC